MHAFGTAEVVVGLVCSVVLVAAGVVGAEPAAAVSATQPVARPIYILPLGDSITQGGMEGREEYSYRWPLYQMLVDYGVDFVFVGSMTTGLNELFTWPEYKGRAFDARHEGHYGWKTAAVRDKLGGWMEGYPARAPDIVLIHLGTNDQDSDDYDRDIVRPLSDMVGMLRARNPRVVVLVGHLNFEAGKAAEIRPLVEKMARRLTTAESPVVTVHHYRGFQPNPDLPGADTFDWAHPNPSGQRKMAQKWFAAMKPFLAPAGQPAATTAPAAAE